MKTFYYILSTAAFVVSLSSFDCQKKLPKDDEALQQFEHSKDILDKEIHDSITMFKTEIGQKLSVNEKRIGQLKKCIIVEIKGFDGNYGNTIAEIEKKNSDLKIQLRAYNKKGKENWFLFRDEMKHDIAEIETSLDNFVIYKTN